MYAADRLAYEKGWLRLDIDAPPFFLKAYLPLELLQENLSDDKILTVYLEGDGYAWRSRSRPSTDPTPIDPVGLRLALRHPDEQVVYLARPCQFISQEEAQSCETRYWTDHRFSPEVIDSSSRAISELMNMTASKSLRLIGYSGGGAVAALVAAKRDDVVQLITVAGNLDHARWTEFHS
ncbi:MAG: hypothetical protein KAU27_02315, partial [Desulfuromonadales bacterium]|nr:hypothetical protein [Desulfuromonadales bacterium]